MCMSSKSTCPTHTFRALKKKKKKASIEKSSVITESILQVNNEDNLLETRIKSGSKAQLQKCPNAIIQVTHIIAFRVLHIWLSIARINEWTWFIDIVCFGYLLFQPFEKINILYMCQTCVSLWEMNFKCFLAKGKYFWPQYHVRHFCFPSSL